MLKIIAPPEKSTSGKLEVGDSELNTISVGNNSMKHTKKLAKSKAQKLSKGLKLFKSGKSKNNKLSKSKKPSKSKNLPKFAIKIFRLGILTLNARTALNRL